MASTMKMTIIMVVLTLISMSWTTTKAQDFEDGTCLDSLLPCLPYRGFSNPPPACCDSLRMVIEIQLSCLCAVINNPTLATVLNTSQIVQLPVDCGIIDVGPNLCTTAAPTPRSSSAPAPPAETSPDDETPPAEISPGKPPSPSRHKRFWVAVKRIALAAVRIIGGLLLVLAIGIAIVFSQFSIVGILVFILVIVVLTLR